MSITDAHIEEFDKEDLVFHLGIHESDLVRWARKSDSTEQIEAESYILWLQVNE